MYVYGIKIFGNIEIVKMYKNNNNEIIDESQQKIGVTQDVDG